MKDEMETMCIICNKSNICNIWDIEPSEHFFNYSLPRREGWGESLRVGEGVSLYFITCVPRQ